VGLRALSPDLSPREGLAPRGPDVLRGTVYADPVGRWLLEVGDKARPGDRVDPCGHPDLRGGPLLLWDGRVLVVEGLRTWLHYSTVGRRWRTVAGGWATCAVLGTWDGMSRSTPDGDALADALRGAAPLSAFQIGSL